MALEPVSTPAIALMTATITLAAPATSTVRVVSPLLENFPDRSRDSAIRIRYPVTCRSVRRIQPSRISPARSTQRSELDVTRRGRPAGPVMALAPRHSRGLTTARRVHDQTRVVAVREQESVRCRLRLSRIELGDLLARRRPGGPAVGRCAVPQVVTIDVVHRAVKRVVPVVYPGGE